MKKLLNALLILAILTLFLSHAYTEELFLNSPTVDALLEALQVPKDASSVITKTWTDDDGATCYFVYYEEGNTSGSSGGSTPIDQSSIPTSADLTELMNWVEEQLKTEAGEQTVEQVHYDYTVYQTAQPVDKTVFWTAQPVDSSVYSTAQPVDSSVYSTAQPVENSVYRTAQPTARPTAAPVYSQQPAREWNDFYTAPTARPAARPTEAPTVSTGDYTTFNSTMQEQKLLNLLNEDRAKNGLAPLELDPQLSELARLKSNDMNSNHYFAHESPTYGNAAQMLDTFNYDYQGVGENIAHHSNVEKAEAAFMSSDGHRRNILGSQWEKVGIGIAYDENGNMYVTQLFAR
ncbi:MAG: hypothetical protein IKH57_01955 [Clostridia bacterium]|nr:hypothetical protein [Clostridia bacterium]